MDEIVSNTKVYGAFIERLMEEQKVSDRGEGTFRASVELRPYDRYCHECDVRYGYVFGIETHRLTMHVSNFLKDGEKHEQGMFPCEFDTKKNPKWPPQNRFEQVGRTLRITGQYFAKPFEVVINPI